MQTKKTIENLRKLDTVLPRITLVTIYKAFFRPNLDYEDSYTTMFLTILSMIDQNLFNITPVFQYEKWGYLQRETISRIRFRFTQTPMVVWKTLSFYKDFKKQASPLPFLFNSCEMLMSYVKECTQRSHFQHKTKDIIQGSVDISWYYWLLISLSFFFVAALL